MGKQVSPKASPSLHKSAVSRRPSASEPKESATPSIWAARTRISCYRNLARFKKTHMKKEYRPSLGSIRGEKRSRATLLRKLSRMRQERDLKSGQTLSRSSTQETRPASGGQ